MMPVTKTYTTAAAQAPIALDYLPVSDITVVVTVGVGGTTSAATLMQLTLDEVHDEQSPQYVAPASARWVTLAAATFTVPAAAGAAAVTFPGPWRAIRMDTTGLAGGNLVFQVAQSTTPRA